MNRQSAGVLRPGSNEGVAPSSPQVWGFTVDKPPVAPIADVPAVNGARRTAAHACVWRPVYGQLTQSGHGYRPPERFMPEETAKTYTRALLSSVFCPGPIPVNVL